MTHLAIHGDKARWVDSDHLLASIVDLLAAANWQRAGRKNTRRPKPVKRPGVDDKVRKRFGDKSYSVDEMDKILDVEGR